MRGLRGVAIAFAALAFATLAQATAPELKIEALASPVKVRLRGLSAFSDSIAWASGREGTVLRTVDGGAHWDVFKVPGADALDFRDAQAFGADVALVMGAGPGDASRVYRTADGGRSWTLVLRNPDAEGFFDCMDFDGAEGRLLGDPVRGRFQVFASSDGGRSWRRTKGPKAAKDEAAFAASGTCLMRVRAGTVVVTGGSRSQIHFLPDRLMSSGDWHALDAGVRLPSASTGLFSIAVRNGWETMAVGGDYKQESGPGVAFGASVLADAARFGILQAEKGERYLAHDQNDLRLRRPRVRDPWYQSELGSFQFFEGRPSGYRSAVACAGTPRAICIATGPAGTDVLPPSAIAATKQREQAVVLDVTMFRPSPFAVASSWQRVSDAGYDSVAIAGNVAWFSGDAGRLGRAELPSSK